MQNILQIEIGNTTAVMIFIVLLALSVVGLYYLAKNVLKTEKRYAEEKKHLS